MTQELQHALELIEQVERLLDLRRRECPACGRTEYSNFNHKRAVDQLNGAKGRLTRTMELLQSEHTGESDDEEDSQETRIER